MAVGRGWMAWMDGWGGRIDHDFLLAADTAAESTIFLLPACRWFADWFNDRSRDAQIDWSNRNTAICASLLCAFSYICCSSARVSNAPRNDSCDRPPQDAHTTHTEGIIKLCCRWFGRMAVGMHDGTSQESRICATERIGCNVTDAMCDAL